MRWIMVLSSLLVLTIISWNLANSNHIPEQIPVSISEPTYQSRYATTVVYTPTGTLNYKLMASDVQYFSNADITWFNQPFATIYHENKMPSWTIRADRAKLTHEKILYLYGHVKVNNLNNTLQLKHIITDNAVINLVTQDIFSDNEVTLCGTGFNSAGIKMHSNLRNQTAELFEKVQTSYEIYNK